LNLKLETKIEIGKKRKENKGGLLVGLANRPWPLHPQPSYISLASPVFSRPPDCVHRVPAPRPYTDGVPQDSHTARPHSLPRGTSASDGHPPQVGTNGRQVSAIPGELSTDCGPAGVFPGEYKISAPEIL
jgi:hypothetical protein